MLTIFHTHDPGDIDLARLLIEEYAQSLGIDLDFQNFARELATLPGLYAPPRGRLLLAAYNGQPAGCVALRDLGHELCEVKRLYVRPQYRQAQIGRALVAAVIAEARAAGYRAMRLDTIPTMAAAQRLYERFGFRNIAPYYQSPIEGTRYMELALQPIR